MNLEELRVKYGNEQVLCVKNNFITLGEDIFKTLHTRGYLQFRYEAELDTSAKQIIPYVIVKHKDKIFATKRLKGDERLVGGYSIGMGGHIDKEDVILIDGWIDSTMTVFNCIYRELKEELGITPTMVTSVEKITSFVDESSEVSKVHCCILFVVELNTDNIEVKETEKLEGKFYSLDELNEISDTLEGWSKIALNIYKSENNCNIKDLEKEQEVKPKAKARKTKVENKEVE